MVTMACGLEACPSAARNSLAVTTSMAPDARAWVEKDGRPGPVDSICLVGNCQSVPSISEEPTNRAG